jgi:uncharacterized protein YndB with AHSA1/START domain
VELAGGTPLIDKTIDLKAPQSRVWKALTEAEQFGAWFRVKFDTPFVVGKSATGHITWPGMEHYEWTAFVTAMDPETYFAFEWHPYAIDLSVDYSKEKPTLVEFRLARVSDSVTRLSLRESGFEHVPEDRRKLALEKNDEGWTVQMKNIESYLA